MSDQYAHGSLSKLTVDSDGSSGSGSPAIFCITKFEWEQKYDNHDVTSTCSAGFKEQQLGLKQVAFNGEAKLDLSQKPWTALQNGEKVSIVWKANGTTANVTIPTAVVESVKITGAVNDVISFTFSGMSSGSYTLA